LEETKTDSKALKTSPTKKKVKPSNQLTLWKTTT
jgi:hypothetical protein